MSTFDLNLLQTLVLATALFFLGHLIVGRSQFLQRYSIPVPVVGGVLFAVAAAVVGLVAHVRSCCSTLLRNGRCNRSPCGRCADTWCDDSLTG